MHNGDAYSSNVYYRTPFWCDEDDEKNVETIELNDK